MKTIQISGDDYESQPWLDYFDMLNRYEQKGFLEVVPDKHEAYITLAALLTLTPGEIQQAKKWHKKALLVVRHIRTYAAWKASISAGFTSASEYDPIPFALHVLKDTSPHDLLLTLLLTRERRWFNLWRKTDCLITIEM